MPVRHKEISRFAYRFAAHRSRAGNKMCDRVRSFHHEFGESGAFCSGGDFHRRPQMAADADKIRGGDDFRPRAPHIFVVA
jgi:hypothetical protein